MPAFSPPPETPHRRILHRIPPSLHLPAHQLALGILYPVSTRRPISLVLLSKRIRSRSRQRQFCVNQTLFTATSRYRAYSQGL